MIRFQQEKEGSFVKACGAGWGGALVFFKQVGRFPLILNLAPVHRHFKGGTARRGWAVSPFALMLACMALAVLFNREVASPPGSECTATAAPRRDMSNILHSIPSLVGSWDVNLYNRFGNQAHETWFGVPLESCTECTCAICWGPKRFQQTELLLPKAWRARCRF